MTATLAIVVLQHGNWQHSIACLQSLVPSVSAGGVRVFLVDNASPDDSVQQLRQWMRGAHAGAPRPVHDTVAAHWWPLGGGQSEWVEWRV
ncbi:MAG TPA: hypothetical protein VE861_11385, partial [Gemmatimonadaceae bacterium]|nr:hypothetical protein [Gemmatimonadaceae bacterium]